MQHFLSVGDREVKAYSFDKSAVQRYQQFFNMPQTTTVLHAYGHFFRYFDHLKKQQFDS